MSATVPATNNTGPISSLFDLYDFEKAAVQAVLDYQKAKVQCTYNIAHNLNKICLATNNMVDNVDKSKLTPEGLAMYNELIKDLDRVHHICSIPNQPNNHHLNVNGAILKATAFLLKKVCSDQVLLNMLDNAYLYDKCLKYDSHSVAEIYGSFTPEEQTTLVDSTTDFFMANPNYMLGLTNLASLLE